jgi:ferric-dicitrate binding protein FerR (iron transport regulator)
MTSEELFRLQEKYLAGLCTDEELALLHQHEADFELLEQPWTSSQGDQHEVKEKILKQLHASMEERPHKTNPFRYYYAAAAVLLVGMFVFLFYPHTNSPEQNLAAARHSRKEIIKPGTTKATLTLADGEVINLDDVQSGLVFRRGNVAVNKVANGKLVYDVRSASRKSGGYNTISTPRGGTYQVVLPDGSNVWLNAASSLRFPAVFSGKERHVELQGEAYFEVAKNKEKPFKVAVNGMDVEVLGTHFNVNAYVDEAQIKTTLLEGSVRLNAGKRQQLLHPGQQARLGKESDFMVAEVNVEEAVAWKKGYFIFENENIESIMRKVARWYDVEVSYQGKVDQGRYGGTVSRFDNVEGVLKSLELTGSVRFKIEGRRITVMR